MLVQIVKHFTRKCRAYRKDKGPLPVEGNIEDQKPLGRPREFRLMIFEVSDKAVETVAAARTLTCVSPDEYDDWRCCHHAMF